VARPPLAGRHDGAVLTLLRRHGTLSRSTISEISGLSPTTVTKVVAPLLERGFVEEVGPGVGGHERTVEARLGRPAIGLRLVPGAATVCGIHIGVGTVRAGLVDALGRVGRTMEMSFDVDEPAETVVRAAAETVQNQLLNAGVSTVVAVGVAAPGAVDTLERTNSLAINLGWREVPVAEVVEDVIGLPTAVGHNVSAMALAENRYGLRADSLAFVYVRAGVGLGLVLRGDRFAGGHHGASELGHIHVVDEGGQTCRCGALGCLETVASEPALSRALAAMGVTLRDGEGPLAVLQQLAPKRSDVAQLRKQLLHYLATGLADTVNLFSPEVVVVGGMLANADEALLRDLGDYTRALVFPLFRESLRIVPSSFGDSVGVVGAAAVALESFIYGVGATRSIR